VKYSICDRNRDVTGLDLLSLSDKAERRDFRGKGKRRKAKSKRD
jgi:hypothetical protein